MKQAEIVKAYVAINKLNRANLPVRDAYSVFKLKKELEDLYQFIIESERKLIEQYNGVVLNGGSVKFESNEVAEKVKVELEALNNADIDVDLRVINIDVQKIQECLITPNDVEALEKIINFE